MGSVDLEQLKARLAKLGVHIDEPPAAEDQSAQHWEPLVESNLERHNKTLAQLLGRCTRVQHVINGSDDVSDHEAQPTRTAAAAAPVRRSRQQDPTTSSRDVRVTQAAAAGRLKPSESRSEGRSAGVSGVPRSRPSTDAQDSGPAVASVADGDSKLLVRAAQRLLEDAQQDAQQVRQSLRAAGTGAAAAATAARRPPGRAAGAPAGTVSSTRKSAAAAVAAAASVDDLRNSPLGTVLAQYKEAQAAWAQERAKLRREAVAARKEASQARCELAKVTRSCEHRAQEVSSLKAALKGRDVLLEELQGRTRQLDDELSRCQEVAAERLVCVSRERDDLQALLLATLERLEGVEAVVAAADATSAAMEERVRVLEAERLAALQTAATARQEVGQLQEARRRLEWQSQLLEKMSKVQLQHNKRKSEALRELLATTDAAAADAAAAEDHTTAPRGPMISSSRARENCSKASAALQDLLDELLNSSAGAPERTSG